MTTTAMAVEKAPQLENQKVARIPKVGPKGGRIPKGEGKRTKRCRYLREGQVRPHGEKCYSYWSHPVLEPPVDIQACMQASLSGASFASGTSLSGASASSGGESTFTDPGRGIKPTVA
jgi:hypothetical protein